MSIDREVRIIQLEALVNSLSHRLTYLSSLATSHGIETYKNSRILRIQQVNNGVYPTDDGDTTFMILCTALVLMMTIPGLGLYYGGMVRLQSVLPVVMQSFGICCIISITWMFWGYSLVFAPTGMPDKSGHISHSSQLIGDGSRLWLYGMSLEGVHQLAPTIPEAAYCTYQLAFAIITAALTCGSFAFKMKFGSVMLFIILWHTVVYCPIAHWVWHQDGFLYQAHVMDFAGGNVVHISSGVAGMVISQVLGSRKGFGEERFEPNNILLTYFGCGILWTGWFGFNPGSALSANSLAGIALLNTQLAAAVAALSWMSTEYIMRKRPTLLGILSGSIAGLVAITPACGYVDATGAFFIGLISGPFCYFGAQMKHKMGFNDAMDAFGIHAIGGILGGVAIGFFATDQYNSAGRGIFYGDNGGQLGVQLYAIVVTIAWSGVVTFILINFVEKCFGLRAEDSNVEESDLAELDYSSHNGTIKVPVPEHHHGNIHATKDVRRASTIEIEPIS